MPAVTSKDFAQKLRSGDLPALLWLFGEESYFLERTCRQVIDCCVPPDARDFNLVQLQGREATARRLLEELQTLPVFAPRRLVLVKAAHEFPAGEQEQFMEYLRHPVPESLLLFCSDKIDRRKKIFQEFQKLGTTIEFKTPYDNQIPGFIRDQLRENSRNMTEGAMELFCRRVGTNLQEIVAELEKLYAFVGETGPIDTEAVRQVVSDVRNNSVFELTDALGQRKPGEALRLLNRLLQDGEAPLGLLSMMVRHFRQLWKIRYLLDRGTPNKDLAKLVGVNPYFVNGLVAQARLFQPDHLQWMFNEFLQADLALKSSGAHPSAILETLVMSATRQKAQ